MFPCALLFHYIQNHNCVAVGVLQYFMFFFNPICCNTLSVLHSLNAHMIFDLRRAPFLQFVKVDHPSCELDCCMASSYLSDDSESDFTVVIEKVGWLNRTWSNGDNESQFMSDPVLSESVFADSCDDQDLLC